MGVPSVLCGVILEAKRNLCQPLGRWSGQNGYPPTHPTYLDRPSPIFDMKWNQTFWERRAGRGRRILELAKPAVQWISPVTGKCQKTRHRLKSSLRYVSFSTKKPAKFVIALQSIPIWLRGVAATTSVELSRGGGKRFWTGSAKVQLKYTAVHKMLSVGRPLSCNFLLCFLSEVPVTNRAAQ